MESEENLTTNQLVVRAMDRTQKVILKLRDMLTESKAQGVVTPKIYDQLHAEIVQAGLLLEKEKERIDTLAETDPVYTEQDDDIFQCTDEELESYEIRISESGQSAA
ncbi:MAG: hypothetical protein WBA57_20920 [Elainellaceae cyanobacterium]